MLVASVLPALAQAPQAAAKGKPEVLAALQKMLRGELGALSQYMVHAEMCDNWGYKRLAGETKKRAIMEMKHAEKLIERMLYLDGTPMVSDLPPLTVGKEVKQQLENDLVLEKGAVTDYNEAIATCRKAGDNGSAQLLEGILQDEEDHLDFLEAQLGMIKDVGLEDYLTEQM
jgi:bacterioferritin